MEHDRLTRARVLEKDLDAVVSGEERAGGCICRIHFPLLVTTIANTTKSVRKR